jgi:hypothetical protein
MIEGAVWQKSRNQCEIAAKLLRIRRKIAEKSHRIVSILAAGQKPRLAVVCAGRSLCPLRWGDR